MYNSHMNVKTIYIELQIPENLQNHMLWVAGLAKEIYDNWSGPRLNETDLLQACLFHDIAKVLSFSDRDESAEKAYQNLVNKYGEDEHEACNKICVEYGLTPRALEILKNNNIKPFIKKARYVLESDDYEHKILRYADSRVAKHGVVTLEERGKEFFERNPGRTPDPEGEEISAKTEQQIQENTIVDVTKISHSDCDRHRNTLLGMET
jgi:hypothetical protein